MIYFSPSFLLPTLSRLCTSSPSVRQTLSNRPGTYESLDHTNGICWTSCWTSADFFVDFGAIYHFIFRTVA